MCCVLYFIQQKIPVEDFTAYHPEQYFVAYYPGRDFVAVCLEHNFLLHLIWNKILLYLIKSAFVSMFFLSKPLWPLPDLPILSAMSLPECEGSPNSTLCLLPELLEELQMSETVSIWLLCMCKCNIDQQGFGKVGVEGKNETDAQLEDFEVFNVRNTVNIIAYSVMSAGKTRGDFQIDIRMEIEIEI